MSRLLVAVAAGFLAVVLGGCGEPEPTGPELGAAFCGWLGRCHPVQEFDLDACRASYEKLELSSTEGVAACIAALDADVCGNDPAVDERPLPEACRFL